jgi:hypothetical protein
VRGVSPIGRSFNWRWRADQCDDEIIPLQSRIESVAEVSDLEEIYNTERHLVTGRNQQLNIKATGETIEKLYKLADEGEVPLGELLKQVLDALDRAGEPC